MGTQLGLSEFRIEALGSLMPSWMRPLEIELDIDFGSEEQPPAAVVDKLLPNSLMLPGMLHIIFNLAEELDASLPYWETFWKQLKMLELLLSHRDRMGTFIHYCLNGTELACRADEFNDAGPTLYESLWGEVLKFCRSCHSRMRSCLKRCGSSSPCKRTCHRRRAFASI
jgi:hypothetical protein